MAITLASSKKYSFSIIYYCLASRSDPSSGRGVLLNSALVTSKPTSNANRVITTPIILIKTASAGRAPYVFGLETDASNYIKISVCIA